MLQAQLLQPINLTPVSPRLAESDLFILERAGPAELAFNEFNPLFDRNRLAVQLNGALGNESILGDELTVSGVWNRLSFSAGQYHYDTDGFRVNNSQDRDIYNLFVQGRLTAATSVQAEFRSENHHFGDLFVQFDPTNFIPEQTTDLDSQTVRLGARHVFNARSALLGSLYWRSEDMNFAQAEQLANVTSNVRSARQTEGYTAELQHLLRLRNLEVDNRTGFLSDRADTSVY